MIDARKCNTSCNFASRFRKAGCLELYGPSGTRNCGVVLIQTFNKRTGIIIIKTEIINEQGIRVMSTICYNMQKVESQSIGETPDPLLRCMHRGRYTGYSIWLLSVIWRKRRSWRPRQAHHPTVSISTVAGLDVQASARRYARRVIGLGGFGRLR